MNAPAELAALMVLRVRGRADAGSVARVLGCAEREGAAWLAALVARGAGKAVANAPELVALTDAGRQDLLRALAAETIDRDALAAVYGRFLAADGDLKQAITTWQLAPEAGQTAAIGGVMRAAADAGGVAADVARVGPRFAPYPLRIADAAAAIATGDVRFVASPKVDSLHQVWFELHEDLLVTLGRTRAA
jgi:hypothetical protein